jgi:plasmid rolling circle replication initiator protein Rep
LLKLYYKFNFATEPTKHKILNLDDAEDGNLINTSDEDKTTDEEKKHIRLRQFGILKTKLLFKI